MSWGNDVGQESRKTWLQKTLNGFFDKFMSGNGLDIGFAGYIDGVNPILPTAIGVDTNYPGYDGRTLPFNDNSQDYVYNSHCLEHILDYKKAIQEWHRVTKTGGFIIIVVPHRDLYEKRLTLPSIFNGDHKRFYTSASLLKEVEDSLPINSYKIRHLRENDEGHVYSDPPEIHSRGLYEIELVLQKLR